MTKTDKKGKKKKKNLPTVAYKKTSRNENKIRLPKYPESYGSCRQAVKTVGGADHPTTAKRTVYVIVISSSFFLKCGNNWGQKKEGTSR